MRLCFALATLLTSLLALAACEAEAPPLILPSGSQTSSGAGGGVPVSHLISVSLHSTMESDPRVAISNDGIVYVVYSGRFSHAATHIGYTVSKDRGASWSAPQILQAEDGSSFRSPDIISDNFGNFYLSFLSYGRNGNGASIYLSRASKGGAFETPARVNDEAEIGFYERPQLTINNASHLVLAYTTLVGGVSQLGVSVSKNGTKWTHSVLTEGTVDHHHPSPCAAYLTVEGNTYLTSLSAGRVSLRRSGDNGETWEIIEVQAAGEQGQIARPPSCVAAANNVWISYGIRKSGGLKAVRVARSADSGETISSWLTLSNPEEATYFAVAGLTLEPPDVGHAAFYAAVGPGDESASLRRVRFTTDDLITPPEEPPEEPEPPSYIDSTVVRAPLTFELNEENDRWLGRRLGLAFDDDQLYIAYVDNVSRESHIALQILKP
jgi:hypothetical protein